MSGEAGLGGIDADAYVYTEAPDTSLWNLLHPNRERLAPEHVRCVASWRRYWMLSSVVVVVAAGLCTGCWWGSQSYMLLGCIIWTFLHTTFGCSATVI